MVDRVKGWPTFAKVVVILLVLYLLIISFGVVEALFNGAELEVW
jgi:hypothetical protein